MFSLPFTYYVFSVLVLYIPFHFFEEALGNFPESMYQHKWIPERITYGHWMANNIFFYYPTLLLGSLVYLFFPGLLFLGLGILIWGVINTLDHIFYTIKDRKISPGLYTGFLYLVIAISGLISVNKSLSGLILILSIASGIVYFVFPIICCMLFNRQFRAIFK